VSNNKVGTGGGGGVGTTAEEPTTADDARQEIRLLFFGTFFHENTVRIRILLHVEIFRVFKCIWKI